MSANQEADSARFINTNTWGPTPLIMIILKDSGAFAFTKVRVLLSGGARERYNSSITQLLRYGSESKIVRTHRIIYNEVDTCHNITND